MITDINSTTTMTFNFDKDEKEAIQKTVKVLDSIIEDLSGYGNTIAPDSVSDIYTDNIERDKINETARFLEYLFQVLNTCADIEIYDF